MSDGNYLVNKRLRSKRHWKKVLKKNGCKILMIRAANCHPQIVTPENNLLVFRKV